MQIRSLKKPWRGWLGALVFLGMIFQATPGPAASTGQDPLLAQNSGAPAVFLPLVSGSWSVGLSSIWTSGGDNHLRSAFRPGETIHFYVNGHNETGSTATAELTWSLDGQCGESTLFTGSMQLTTSNWTFSQTTVAPECEGIHQYSLRIKHQDRSATLSIPFLITPPSQVILSDKQAFDKCNIPSLDEMFTWWTSSPYYSINLYIGGIARACANRGLDAFWIYKASQQGWSYIPTWVGPQAPCSKFSKKMSSDPAKTYLEGRNEANAAADTALQLGLADDNVIYYDLEAYSSATQLCRDAVKAFMTGWVEGLHERGIKAGGYGAPCSSYMFDWTSISPMPDNVWIAAWNSKTYDPDASVWGVPCLSDVHWAEQQRIRQYAGDHVETWGGLSMIIDSNIADGAVSYLPPSANSIITPKGTEGDGMAQATLRQMEQGEPGQGWVLAGQSLFRTDTGGLEWRQLSPGDSDHAALHAADFLDEQRGWLLTTESSTGDLAVRRTADGGDSWQIFSLNLSGDLAEEVRPLSLNFTDEHNGWISLQLPSSSNFSLGMLLSTSDGGQTWRELPLPVAAPVRFMDAQRGWVAGGVRESELFHTSDGGATWQPLSLGAEAESPDSAIYPGLPVFRDSQHGLLPVTVADPQAGRVDIHATRDGGSSWRLVASIPFDNQSQVAGAIQLEQAGPGRLSLFLAGQSQAILLDPGGNVIEIIQLRGLPQGIVDLKVAASGSLLARLEQGYCQGTKLRPGEPAPPPEESFRCELYSAVLASHDNGQSWREVTPGSDNP